jgi:hypothetical protein
MDDVKKKIREAVVEIILTGWVEVGYNDHEPSTMLIDGKWMKGKWGCDTMQHLIDSIRREN